jgi:hypothetical protein
MVPRRTGPLDTIHGVNKRTAEVLIAELGADLETTMKMGAWAVFVLLLLAPSSVGSEGSAAREIRGAFAT